MGNRSIASLAAGVVLFVSGAVSATLVTGVADDSPARQLGFPSALLDFESVDVQLPQVEFDLERSGLVSSMRTLTREVYRYLPPPAPREVTVYLDGDGATLYPGPDHGGLGTSSLLLARGINRMDIPAYQASERRWNSLHKCVESRFDGFAVNVVDEKPTSGDYITVHIGGHPNLIGRDKSTRGLAPLTGRPISNAPVFVFTHGKPSLTELCDATAHEVGHALGLDHSRLCSDIMSYGSCGPKRFRDDLAACGEDEDRECESGDAEQSSRATLEEHVGLRPTTPARVS